MQPRKKLETLLFPVAALLVVALLLFAERAGVAFQARQPALSRLPEEAVRQKPLFSETPKECLTLIDSTFPFQEDFIEQFTFVLKSMWVGYEFSDVAAQKPLPALENYKTVVIAFPDLSKLGGALVRLNQWVEQGGRVMFLYPCEPSPTLGALADKLGISDGGTQYSKIYGMRIKTDFMAGGKDFTYEWGDYPYVALSVSLKPSATAHMVSETGMPLLWENPYGKGRYVVNNLDMIEKNTRGYIGAAYSLLYDDFAYPVINSAVFFLDDFPSPVPMGNGEYISKYFHRDIASFYSSVWWPDMLELGKRYGIKYTGLIIESYDDKTAPPFERYQDVSRFNYFGRMLLSEGGEIGYHGYNHQPLCFDGFDYKGKVDYHLWHSEEGAAQSVQEMADFRKTLFPENNASVYVPPSNILSEEGRTMLVSRFPQIKTLSGVYLKEDYEYEQEFCVSGDGIVELPRITSGTQIDGYMHWSALNELNFHFVSSHFMHPDDVLDEDRGAAKGWNSMRDTLEQYLRWLADSAPSLRHQTGSEASGAVQRYDGLGLRRISTPEGLTLEIDNFHDEAYFLARIRGGASRKVTGGSLEQLSGDLYLLKATANRVKIEIER